MVQINWNQIWAETALRQAIGTGDRGGIGSKSHSTELDPIPQKKAEPEFTGSARARRSPGGKY